MTISFPDIAPTSRSFRPPSWPATRKRSQAGVTSIRLWGSKQSDGSLALGFANIPDSRAAQILATHRQAKGHVLPIELPAIILKGMELELQEAFLSSFADNGLAWFFAENDPPTVESVKRGVSSVRLTLTAELRLK